MNTSRRSATRDEPTPVTREATVTTATRDRAQEQIRDLIDRWADGARTGDLDRIMACYTPDVVAFDAIVKLQFRGTETYRDHWSYCMGFVQGDMIMEVHDLEITVD